VDRWAKAATEHLDPTANPPADPAEIMKAFTRHRDAQEDLKTTITHYREVVTHFNLPYLALPAVTPKDTALQVFINMNTNTKPLSLYDIIVAEVESAKGVSLHEMQEDLEEKVPHLSRFDDVARLFLAAAALLQNKQASERGMIDMDKAKLVERWDELAAALQQMVSFMEGLRIYDGQRLPSNVVLPVIAALYPKLPASGDARGQAETLLRKYAWRCFCSDRYENSANSRSFADFRALCTAMERVKDGTFSPEHECAVPALNPEMTPLVDPQELLTAGWPRRQTTVGRAILAVTAQLGAFDFADGGEVTPESIEKREYHHIFPHALLEEVEAESSLALNCALISGPTNRHVGRKDPLQYLKERHGWVSNEIVEQRLASHLIPMAELARGGYEGMDGDARVARIKADFAAFLQTRAVLMHAAMRKLAAGERITAAEILASPAPHAAESAVQ
jgi:hypothetical protein